MKRTEYHIKTCPPRYLKRTHYHIKVCSLPYQSVLTTISKRERCQIKNVPKMKSKRTHYHINTYSCECGWFHKINVFVSGSCQEETTQKPIKCYECSNLLDPKCGRTWGYEENSQKALDYVVTCPKDAVACKKLEYEDSLQGKKTGMQPILKLQHILNLAYYKTIAFNV